MATPRVRRTRPRGEIKTLPSGSLQVRVYAGVDPLTGRRHILTKTVPAGPTMWAEAEQEKTKLLNQVDEQRNPRTRATVSQLMARHLELLNADDNTRRSYESCARNHIEPLLGSLQVGKLNGETLDSFYSILSTCRAHCGGRKFIEHREDGEHVCDEKCKPHQCRPLSPASIRKVHWCLSGAMKRAVRWRWIAVNPITQADPPSVSAPNPTPPTPEQAAAILNRAFRDLPWGMLVWLAMTTGARRGELCALSWDRIDFKAAVLSIRTSIGQDGARTWEKDTKTHQQRRIALDTDSVALLKSYRQWCEEQAALIGTTLAPDSRVFSLDPDHRTWLKPDSVTQRYRRMCAKLGWDMHIHQLRHYSATELIAAGVDVRTVAGRLGHGGGGATTLRVYSAWVSEADQRAAGNLAARMPRPPVALTAGGLPEVHTEPEQSNAPYQRIAADLRGAIMCGAFKAGDKLPTVTDLAQRYEVAFGTAQRAISELRKEGLIVVSRGRRAVAQPHGAGHRVKATDGLDYPIGS